MIADVYQSVGNSLDDWEELKINKQKTYLRSSTFKSCIYTRNLIAVWKCQMANRNKR